MVCNEFVRPLELGHTFTSAILDSYIYLNKCICSMQIKDGLTRFIIHIVINKGKKKLGIHFRVSLCLFLKVFLITP